jgi:hypothetical protein
MQPFEGCWQRVERAKSRSETLAKDWASFIDNEPYGTSLEMQEDGTGSLQVWNHYDSFPAEFALNLGELLYQLRSALDSCVYDAAVLQTGKNPPPNESNLAFPICSSPSEFKNATRNIRPLSDQLKRAIEVVQPYHAPKTLNSNELVSDTHRTLKILHDWARIDRHRKLHVMGSWASNARPSFRLPDGVSILSLHVNSGVFLEDEHEIARFALAGYCPGMNVEANPDLSIDIAVNEVPPPCCDTDTLGNRVGNMIAIVKGTIRGFEKFFGLSANWHY